MEDQVMRLPRYARGLRLVRVGMFLMLGHLAISVYVVTLSMRSTPDNIGSLIDWSRYNLYAHLLAVGAMLVGAVISLPDFTSARMGTRRLVLSILGFGVALAAMAWSLHVITRFGDLIVALTDHPLDIEDSQLAALDAAVEDLGSLRLMSILQNLGYPIGVVGILRSVRQTAVANDHYALRDAASQVTGIVVGLAVADMIYQLLFGMRGIGMLGLITLVFGLLGGLAIAGGWVYCHLRLAKFLKAAAILVHEPHALPVATLIVRDKPAAAPPEIPRPIAPSSPSAPPVRPSAQPIVTVAAELRPVAAPRASTATEGAADEPKLLR